MRRKRGRRTRRAVVVVGAVLLAVVIATAIFSLFVNRRIPDNAESGPALSELDRARVREALHLVTSIGNVAWPGWGDDPTPLLVYDEENAYLFGADTPPRGWQMRDGVYWSDQERDWQAFAEELGDGTWVGSMSTKAALDLFLVQQVGSIVPDALEPVVPLGLVVTSTEHYITSLLHEAFHAYQAEAAPARFADAQLAYAYEEVYHRAAESMDERWKEEARLLARALAAESDAESADLVRQWLHVRSAGRADLEPELATYERRLEWLEGLAKYVELGIWEAASEAEDYEPLDSLAVDDRFHGYTHFERRLRGEVATLRASATRSGDGRFYYTGMAQARLLDRLMPEWHRQAFRPRVWLDELLDKAVG